MMAAGDRMRNIRIAPLVMGLLAVWLIALGGHGQSELAVEQVDGGFAVSVVDEAGEDRLLFLDSGATHSLFFDLGPVGEGARTGETFRLEFPFAETSVEADILTPLTFMAASTVITVEDPLLVDRARTGLRIGDRIDGILGIDFFAQHFIWFDAARARLTLLPSGAEAPVEGTYSLPLEAGFRQVFAAADVAGRPYRLLVDTGYSGSVQLYSMTEETARARGMRVAVRRRDGARRFDGVLPLCLGGTCFEARVFAEPRPAYPGAEPQGILGLGLMARGAFGIDVQAGRLVLSVSGDN